MFPWSAHNISFVRVLANNHNFMEEILHTGYAAIENGNTCTIDERRSKIARTEFLIAIGHPAGDKWQWKTLFLVTFDPSLSVVKSVYDCGLSGVFW